MKDKYPLSSYKVEVDLPGLKQLAINLGELVQIGEVITLSGELGVGKSSFARYFIKSLMEKDVDIASPTFTLVQVYNTVNCNIWHFDLYRIKQKEEVFELGIEDAFNFGVALIEWPFIIESLLPADRIEIEFSFVNENDNKRIVTLVPYGIWQQKIRLIFKE
jgi:tRNA threonylcarbamoyladenosine biosynthesis protein TsaE